MAKTTTQRGMESRIVDNRCQNCESFITRDFARVFGDNQNTVQGCLNCMSGTDVKAGHASYPQRE
ncbi:DUF7563 family protein [Haladaptatus pallidirubidus]|uniref:DUF7563 family protein n=1 Tax=Haladaptatus pallidirubidus TaxID=1008152 RepID=UPI00406BD496